MSVLDLRDLEIRNKKVLIREDLNVPINEGKVANDARIRAAMPTIEYALAQGAKVMVMSHLGRPEEGVPVAEQPQFSMAPVARHMSGLLGRKVPLIEDYLDGFDWDGHDIVLFENVRVNPGEKANDPALAQKLGDLCDIFVMDAFGTAHRAQATTEGIARFAAVACAGPLLAAELDALEKAVADPEHPVVAIVGGSKVSTKLDVLEALADKVDSLVVGGGIANTFLAARGINVGKSLHEPDLVDTAKRLLDQVDVALPVDVVVAREISGDTEAVLKEVDEVADDEMILDLGPRSMAAIGRLIEAARTIVWNGPVGVFEFEPFAEGTRQLSLQIAANEGFSIAGGGDTLAAIDRFGVTDRISYISTGGGAFLEFVEGKKLPAVAALEARAEG